MARSSTPSSSLTSMRSAWKVRLAGLPGLVRCTLIGIASRTSSTRRADMVQGVTSRSATIRSAMRRAKRSSPYSRSTRVRSSTE